MRAAYFDAALVRTGPRRRRPRHRAGAAHPGHRRAAAGRCCAATAQWFARTADDGADRRRPGRRCSGSSSDGTPAVQRVRARDEPAAGRRACRCATATALLRDRLAARARAAPCGCSRRVLGAGRAGDRRWPARRSAGTPAAGCCARWRTVADAAGDDRRRRLHRPARPATPTPTSTAGHRRSTAMVDQLSAPARRPTAASPPTSATSCAPRCRPCRAATSVLDRRRATLDERTAAAVDLLTDEVDRFQPLVDRPARAGPSRPAGRAPADRRRRADPRACSRRAGCPPERAARSTGDAARWLASTRAASSRSLANLLDNAGQARRRRRAGRACAVGDDGWCSRSTTRARASRPTSAS